MENKINYEFLGSVDSPSDPRDYRISDIASLNGGLSSATKLYGF